MSVAEQTPVVDARVPRKRPPRRNGRWSGYLHLLGARMLELKREPEVVFWVFVFPLLLATGLGIAFRNKPTDAIPVAIARQDTSQPSLFISSEIEFMLAHSPLHAFKPQLLTADDAHRGFRLGKYDLIVEVGGKTIGYIYDPARPESILAKSEVDDALQSAAGRKDVITTSVAASSEPGSRYIDFLIPGLLGMNLMNSGMWGIGFALVDMRQRKLLKRFVGTPMRRGDFLLALLSSRLMLMIIEIALLLTLGVIVFHMRVLGSIFSILLLGPAGAMCFWRSRIADGQPRAEDRKRERADESGDDADVDFFRRVLLLRALPCRDSAADQGLAADGAERCAAGEHSGRHAADSSMAATVGDGRVGRSFVLAGAEMVSLDLVPMKSTCRVIGF